MNRTSVYAYLVRMAVNTMKTNEKKVSRLFRLEPELDAELIRRNRATGIPKTRIVEDALRDYFNRAMREKLEKAAKSFSNALGRSQEHALSA